MLQEKISWPAPVAQAAPTAPSQDFSPKPKSFLQVFAAFISSRLELMPEEKQEKKMNLISEIFFENYSFLFSSFNSILIVIFNTSS